MDQLVLWQKIEGALIFIAALVLFLHLASGLVWWLALLVFFAPDLGFAGYLLGPRIGAVSYNLLHLYAFPVVVLVAGWTLSLPLLSALGALWLAHCGFDRMLGYGLKSTEGFAVTHLGRIGRQRIR